MRDPTPGPAAEAAPARTPDSGSAKMDTIPPADLDRVIAKLSRAAALPADEELSLSLEQAIEGLLAHGIFAD